MLLYISKQCIYILIILKEKTSILDILKSSHIYVCVCVYTIKLSNSAIGIYYYYPADLLFYAIGDTAFQQPTATFPTCSDVKYGVSDEENLLEGPAHPSSRHTHNTFFQS